MSSQFKNFQWISLLALPCAFGALLSTAATAEPPAASPDTEETLYYDYVDDQGRLSGGQLQIPFTPIETAIPHGGANNRIDLVTVGDGYTAAQLANYHSQANNAVNALFNQQPFAMYRNFFLVHTVDVVSNETGVDNDPSQGILRDTAMDMAFWCSGIERLLCINVAKAYNFANTAGDVDQILAVANSTKYGGAGYTTSELVTIAGGNNSAQEIAIHEFGHSIGNLGDEYDYADGATYVGQEPAYPDVSKLTASQMMSAGTKWTAWLNSNDVAYDGLVSTYQGAAFYQFGLYRPTNNSRMRTLGRPFNHPSAESLIIEFYKTVRPIDDSTPTNTILNGNESVFVDPVDPVGNPLAIQWSLDNAPIQGATTATLQLATLTMPPGNHVLSVAVADNTTLVRNETARSLWMKQGRNWNISVPATLGDLNCDGLVTQADASVLSMALITPELYTTTYPNCPVSQADVNLDSNANGLDIAALIHILIP